MVYAVDWSAVAAFSAAAVALFAAWRSHDIAKANINNNIDIQLVQFRERWIQSLREKMVEFISLYSTRLENNADLKALDAAGHSILLMMNPEDDLYKGLKKQITVGVIRTINASTETNLPKFSKKEIDMINDRERFNPNLLSKICQEILKKEWDRLKLDLRDKNAKNQ